MNRVLSIMALALLAGTVLMPTTAWGNNVYVTNCVSNGTIGKYDATTGAVVNASLVSGLYYPTAIAVSGSNLFVLSFDSGSSTGTIGEYTTSGAVVNASLVSWLNHPTAIAVSGSNLFVTSNWTDTVLKYNATTGALVNASLVSGLNDPEDIAVSGANLFVTTYNSGRIGEYTTSGAVVNASLVSGLNNPTAIAVSGSNIFVMRESSGTIGEYTTSGGTVNASLISGTNSAGIAVSGSNLFVTNVGSGTIDEYDATTGAMVNASLITRLNDPWRIAFDDAPVPEPLTMVALSMGFAGLGGYIRRRRAVAK